MFADNDTWCMARRLSLVKRFLVLFCLVVCGCGGGSGNTIMPPPQIQDISGQWSFIATDTANNQTAVFANFTSQGGGNFFATGMNTAVCDIATAQCQVAQNTPSITATVTSSGQITVTVSNVVTTAGATVTVNASGTVASSTMSGNWTASDGASGTFTGYKSSSFTGSYTGSVNSTVAPSPIPIGVSVTIAQDSSYNLTADASLTNSACYTSLSFSGHTVGGIFYLTNTASSGVAANSVVVVGIQSNPTTPNVFQAGYQLLAGCDAGDQGTGTLTKQ